MRSKEIKVSPEFKAETTKAISSIVLFAVCYSMLLAFAGALAVLCLYAALALVLYNPGFITIALGIGLASLGILVFVFLVKFIFQFKKVDRSHLREIKKEDEPKLFELIDEIVKEVGTSQPKKVFLSPEVNAAVFYDSTFWSMFFPVKKNLLIGMGLVNTVTKEELKAILCHEFGHFSQKTMKLGSYVHNVNQVIYNMLYDNDSYEKVIQRWGEASGYFFIFVAIAVKIIQAIQWCLKLLFAVVNKSHLALSREMEFHADEIAASITGSEPLKTALLRLSHADAAYQTVLAFYEEKISDNVISENVFREHGFALNFLAKEQNIPIANGLPNIALEELGKNDMSKLNIEDQWTSHPSTEERINRLESLGYDQNVKDHELGTKIFINLEKFQREITNTLFHGISFEATPISLSLEKFASSFEENLAKNSFPKVYNGYYDQKNPVEFDLEAVPTTQFKSVEDLFSDANVQAVYQTLALENDIETLKRINLKELPIRNFHYDGKHFHRKQTSKVLTPLFPQLEAQKENIKQIDQSIFYFFLTIEASLGGTPKLKEMYRDFFHFDKNFDDKYELVNKLMERLQFLHEVTPHEQIQKKFKAIEYHESALKLEIQHLLYEKGFEKEIPKEVKDALDLYSSKNWQYFEAEKYLENNLEILSAAINGFQMLLSKAYFITKKQLLDYQVSLLETKNEKELSMNKTKDAYL